MARETGPVSIDVAVALGANLGDRHATLAWAVQQLETILTDVRVSAWHDTAPVDAPPPRFLNGAVIGRTTLSATALLDRLQRLEIAAGRERPFHHAPRTLDLDLVLYGDRVIDVPGLRVPHPRFRERRFVLEPLAEIAGEWKDPETGRTVAQLLGDLPADASNG